MSSVWRGVASGLNRRVHDRLVRRLPDATDARAYYLQEAAKFELIVHEVLQRRLF